MHRCTLIILLSFLASLKAFSCGNIYGHDWEGKRVWLRDYTYLSDYDLVIDTAGHKRAISKIQLNVKRQIADYKDHSDWAYHLMHIGELDSALHLLKPLQQAHPKEYGIASNLGTVYELKGELDSALKYISIGLTINPHGHHRTEWIHKEILQAKIKHKRIPRWFETHEIVSTKMLIDSVRKSDRPNHVMRDLVHTIWTQVRTRAPFTPAPDPVIANLCLTLGDVQKEVGTYENALLSYVTGWKYAKTGKMKYRRRIVELNEMRDSLDHINEVPWHLMRLIKQGKVDPDFLFMGIDSVSEQLHAHDMEHHQYEDSLEHLHTHIDSLEKLSSGLEATPETVIEKPAINATLIGVLSGVAGAGLMALLFVGVRKRNKTK